MKLKIEKVRDVIVKLIIDEKDMAIVNDNDVLKMVAKFTSNDAIDEKGNRGIFQDMSSGDTIIRRIKDPLEEIGDIIGENLRQNNYIARVDVLTIARRRIYDVYDIKENYDNEM